MVDDLSGKTMWFEYHCLESHDSSDAHLWYRSHQQVEVLAIEHAGTGYNPKERSESGDPRVYRIRFRDGLVADVFEDELMDSPKRFFRPDPPKPRED